MVLDKRGGEQQTLVEQARVRHILVRPSRPSLRRPPRRFANFASNWKVRLELAREHSDDGVRLCRW